MHRRVIGTIARSVGTVAILAAAASGLVAVAAGPAARAASEDGFRPVPPVRLLDTRTGSGPVGPGGTIDVAVAGTAGVPATGVGAVVVNLTATRATATSYVTAWGTGTPRPLASNLNTDPGQDTPNLAIVAPGPDGRISLYNDAGTTHLVADLLGWFPTGTAYTPTTPTAAPSPAPAPPTPASTTGPPTTTTARPTTTTTPPTTTRAPTGAVLYLTFDDGPNPIYTPQILGVLDRYGARATFFQMGSLVSAFPNLSQAVQARGHRIANHSWSHPDLTTLSTSQITTELVSTSNVIEQTVGRRPPCMRPPFGATNATVNSVAASLGMSVELWDIDTRDWTEPGGTAIAAAIVQGARPGAVVLLHDGGGDRSGTVDGVSSALAQLSAQGYQFAALPQC